MLWRVEDIECDGVHHRRGLTYLDGELAALDSRLYYERFGEMVPIDLEKQIRKNQPAAIAAIVDALRLHWLLGHDSRKVRLALILLRRLGATEALPDLPEVRMRMLSGELEDSAYLVDIAEHDLRKLRRQQRWGLGHRR